MSEEAVGPSSLGLGAPIIRYGRLRASVWMQKRAEGPGIYKIKGLKGPKVYFP